MVSQKARIRSIHQRPFIRKITACTLALVFSLQTAVHAAPSFTLMPTHSHQIQGHAELSRLHIPEAYGSIRGRFIGKKFKAETSRRPLVIFLQDAHGHEEAQLNTFKILQHLHQGLEINTYLMEGGTGVQNPALLRFFQNPKLNQSLADRMVKEGQIGGAELFFLERQIAQDGSLKIRGIEDPVLYKENFDRYRAVMIEQSSVQKYLDYLQKQLELLGSREMNRELKSFIKSWLILRLEDGEWASRLSVLKSWAQEKLGLNLLNPREQIRWPQLVRLQNLLDMEKPIDLDQVRQENERLRIWTVEHHLESYWKDMDFIQGERKKDPENTASFRRLLEAFYEQAAKKGFSFKTFPNWTRQAAVRILKSELNPQEVITEITALETDILKRLASSAWEKEWVVLFQDYQKTKKLLTLQLVPEEYRQLIGYKAALEPQNLMSRLEKLEGTFDSKKPKDHLAVQIQDVYLNALAFYDLAKAREPQMMENVLTQIETDTGEAVVLIAGGFHSQGILDVLKQEGVSFLEIVPRLSTVSSAEIYRKGMLFNSDQATFKSHLRPLSRMQPLSTSWLPLLGPDKVNGVVRLLNSALGQVIAGQKGSFLDLIGEINQSPAFQGHDLRYQARSENKEGQVLFLNGGPVIHEHQWVGLMPAGPRYFPAESPAGLSGASEGVLLIGRSEIRSQPQLDLSIPLRLDKWTIAKAQIVSWFEGKHFSQIVMTKDGSKTQIEAAKAANIFTFASGSSLKPEEALKNLLNAFRGSLPKGPAKSASSFKLWIGPHPNASWSEGTLPTLFLNYESDPSESRSEMRAFERAIQGVEQADRFARFQSWSSAHAKLEEARLLFETFLNDGDSSVKRAAEVNLRRIAERKRQWIVQAEEAKQIFQKQVLTLAWAFRDKADIREMPFKHAAAMLSIPVSQQEQFQQRVKTAWEIARIFGTRRLIPRARHMNFLDGVTSGEMWLQEDSVTLSVSESIETESVKWRTRLDEAVSKRPAVNFSADRPPVMPQQKISVSLLKESTVDQESFSEVQLLIRAYQAVAAYRQDQWQWLRLQQDSRLGSFSEKILLPAPRDLAEIVGWDVRKANRILNDIRSKMLARNVQQFAVYDGEQALLNLDVPWVIQEYLGKMVIHFDITIEMNPKKALSHNLERYLIQFLEQSVLQYSNWGLFRDALEEGVQQWMREHHLRDSDILSLMKADRQTWLKSVLEALDFDEPHFIFYHSYRRLLSLGRRVDLESILQGVQLGGINAEANLAIQWMTDLNRSLKRFPIFMCEGLPFPSRSQAESAVAEQSERIQSAVALYYRFLGQNGDLPPLLSQLTEEMPDFTDLLAVMNPLLVQRQFAALEVLEEPWPQRFVHFIQALQKILERKTEGIDLEEVLQALPQEPSFNGTPDAIADEISSGIWEPFFNQVFILHPDMRETVDHLTEQAAERSELRSGPLSFDQVADRADGLLKRLESAPAEKAHLDQLEQVISALRPFLNAGQNAALHHAAKSGMQILESEKKRIQTALREFEKERRGLSTAAAFVFTLEPNPDWNLALNVFSISSDSMEGAVKDAQTLHAYLRVTEGLQRGLVVPAQIELLQALESEGWVVQEGEKWEPTEGTNRHSVPVMFDELSRRLALWHKEIAVIVESEISPIDFWNLVAAFRKFYRNGLDPHYEDAAQWLSQGSGRSWTPAQVQEGMKIVIQGMKAMGVGVLDILKDQLAFEYYRQAQEDPRTSSLEPAYFLEGINAYRLYMSAPQRKRSRGEFKSWIQNKVPASFSSNPDPFLNIILKERGGDASSIVLHDLIWDILDIPSQKFIQLDIYLPKQGPVELAVRKMEALPAPSIIHPDAVKRVRREIGSASKSKRLELLRYFLFLCKQVVTSIFDKSPEDALRSLKNLPKPKGVWEWSFTPDEFVAAFGAFLGEAGFARVGVGLDKFLNIPEQEVLKLTREYIVPPKPASKVSPASAAPEPPDPLQELADRIFTSGQKPRVVTHTTPPVPLPIAPPGANNGGGTATPAATELKAHPPSPDPDKASPENPATSSSLRTENPVADEPQTPPLSPNASALLGLPPAVADASLSQDLERKNLGETAIAKGAQSPLPLARGDAALEKTPSSKQDDPDDSELFLSDLKAFLQEPRYAEEADSPDIFIGQMEQVTRLPKGTNWIAHLPSDFSHLTDNDLRAVWCYWRAKGSSNSQVVSSESIDDKVKLAGLYLKKRRLLTSFKTLNRLLGDDVFVTELNPPMDPATTIVSIEPIGDFYALLGFDPKTILQADWLEKGFPDKFDLARQYNSLRNGTTNTESILRARSFLYGDHQRSGAFAKIRVKLMNGQHREFTMSHVTEYQDLYRQYLIYLSRSELRSFDEAQKLHDQALAFEKQGDHGAALEHMERVLKLFQGLLTHSSSLIVTAAKANIPAMERDITRLRQIVEESQASKRKREVLITALALGPRFWGQGAKLISGLDAAMQPAVTEIASELVASSLFGEERSLSAKGFKMLATFFTSGELVKSGKNGSFSLSEAFGQEVLQRMKEKTELWRDYTERHALGLALKIASADFNHPGNSERIQGLLDAWRIPNDDSRQPILNLAEKVSQVLYDRQMMTRKEDFDLMNRFVEIGLAVDFDTGKHGMTEPLASSLKGIESNAQSGAPDDPVFEEPHREPAKTSYHENDPKDWVEAAQAIGEKHPLRGLSAEETQENILMRLRAYQMMLDKTGGNYKPAEYARILGINPKAATSNINALRSTLKKVGYELEKMMQPRSEIRRAESSAPIADSTWMVAGYARWIFAQEYASAHAAQIQESVSPVAGLDPEDYRLWNPERFHQALQMKTMLESSRDSIHIVLRIHEAAHPGMVDEVLDAISLLKDFDSNGSLRFLLLIDHSEQTKALLSSKISEFLSRRYGSQFQKRNHMLASLKVVSTGDAQIERFLNSGASSLWTEWSGNQALQSRTLKGREDYRVYADRLASGEWIDLEAAHHGVATSVLQAVHLLRVGPEKSGLKPMQQPGLYGQQSQFDLRRFSEVFNILKAISASA